MNLPDEFLNRMKQYLGDEYEAFKASYSSPVIKGLRLSATGERTSPVAYFDAANFEKVPWEDNGFSYISGDISPGKHPYHEAGVYYIQEPSAMAPVYYLDIRPGDRVLDLCASPGGKSTQIGSKMQNKGILISNEINIQRAKILSENMERMGISNALVINHDPVDISDRFCGFFDKVLVDAPCSGEGMFRRADIAIEEWSPDNVIMCAKRQAGILDEAAKMVRDGGTLVYSTCTFSKEENEHNIISFLERHSGFELSEMKLFDGMVRGFENTGVRLYPHKLSGEGHYVCKFIKKCTDESDGGISSGTARFKYINGLATKAVSKLKDMMSFFDENLTDNIKEEILSKKLVRFGDNIHMVPDECPDLDGLKILRTGLHLGTVLKNRFEPSHALAKVLTPANVKNSINILNNDVIYKYLRGESLSWPEHINDGWTLICYDGYALGWGKSTNGIVKNHYPKGLRKSF